MFVFNMTCHPVFSKLKNILPEIHLLQTPDREHDKVFEKIPIIELEEQKSWKTFLWEQKQHFSKRGKVVADHVEVLGVKYANMWLPKHWDFSVSKENIALSPITWTVVPAMFFAIFFHAKHVQNIHR